MSAVYGSVFPSLLGWLLALPQQFAAIHGWPGLAALVAGGVFLVKLAKNGARPWIAIPVLALVALLAWWFWPERKPPLPAPPRIARHGNAPAVDQGEGYGRRAALPPEVRLRKPQLNALCPVCGLLFRTRLSAQERTRCPRCNAVISVRRARALFSFQPKRGDRWTD